MLQKTLPSYYEIMGEDDLESGEFVTESRASDRVATDCSSILGVGDRVCFLLCSGFDIAAVFRVNGSANRRRISQQTNGF